MLSPFFKVQFCSNFWSNVNPRLWSLKLYTIILISLEYKKKWINACSCSENSDDKVLF